MCHGSLKDRCDRSYDYMSCAKGSSAGNGTKPDYMQTHISALMIMWFIFMIMSSA